MGLNIVGSDPQCVSKEYDGLIVSVLRGIYSSEVMARLGGIRRQGHGLLERAYGIVHSSLLGVSHPQIEVRPPQGWIQIDGFAQLPDAALEVALLSQQLTEIAVSFGIVGIQTKGFFEVGLG